MTAGITPRGPRRPDRVEMLVDVSSVVGAPELGERKMAVDVFLPHADAAPAGTPPIILCCLPGGGVDRRYYDLDVPGDPSPTHSFARYLTAAGLVVVSADHLSVGESSPTPPLELTVEVLAAAAHHAMDSVTSALRSGGLDDRLPPLAEAVAVGVGHSMGAMLTVIQQAAHRSYIAVALLGFANRGLPDFLPADLAAFADDQDALRKQLPEILRSRQGAVPRAAPEPAQGRRMPRHGPLFHGDKLDDDVADAVRAIAAPAPPLAAMTSVVPGSIAREMAAIDVPVFLANGDLDITGPVEDIVPRFKSSPGVSVVILPETAHSHHAFPGRVVLWEELAAWARTVAGHLERSR